MMRRTALLSKTIAVIVSALFLAGCALTRTADLDVRQDRKSAQSAEAAVLVPGVLPEPSARPEPLLLAQRLHAELDPDAARKSREAIEATESMASADMLKTADFEAYLSSDGQVFRMAVTFAGWTAWEIALEDVKLTESRSSGLPKHLRAEQLLRDIALAYWPSDYLQPKLGCWRLLVQGNSRRLVDPQNHTMFAVRYDDGASAEKPEGRITIENVAEGYRLTIDSRSL